MTRHFGGRIGFKPNKDMEFGASYYTGAYTIDGQQDLSIMDFDAEYNRDKLTVRGEYVRAIQDTSTGDLKKHGFYAEAAYRVNRHFEPIVRYDQTDLDDGSGHELKGVSLALSSIRIQNFILCSISK